MQIQTHSSSTFKNKLIKCLKYEMLYKHDYQFYFAVKMAGGSAVGAQWLLSA